jgi:hypothetical protein
MFRLSNAPHAGRLRRNSAGTNLRLDTRKFSTSGRKEGATASVPGAAKRLAPAAKQMLMLRKKI